VVLKRNPKTVPIEELTTIEVGPPCQYVFADSGLGFGVSNSGFGVSDSELWGSGARGLGVWGYT
jgi:hypothetical protein